MLGCLNSSTYKWFGKHKFTLGNKTNGIFDTIFTTLAQKLSTTISSEKKKEYTMYGNNNIP